MTDKENIAHNIQIIKDRISNACRLAGRNENDVRLLLATKTVDAARIKMALATGETLIGENRVQEYAEKFDALKDMPCEKHFIGHLQTNKIKEVIKYVSCIHSLDRPELAEKLHQRLLSENKTIAALVEVNTSFEESKHGLPPAAVMTFLQNLQDYHTINVKGFMTIGLLHTDMEKVRPSFTMLRKLRDEAISKKLVPATAVELSMGMSRDLEMAIEEGATIVRVGSAIFGKRLYH